MNERISYIIKSFGIKKVEFATALNLSGAMISKLCSGDGAPSDRTIADICRIFNVNEAWLRTGIGEPFIQLSREDETEEQHFLRLFSQASPAVRLAVATLLEACNKGGENV